MNHLSGAHRTLPLQTKVMVENPKTGKSAIVRVNDRGPFVKSRVMDLSRQGARDLGYIDHGTAYLDFTVLPKSSKAAAMPSKDAEK
jgi:rare lipoprotein A